VGTGALRIDALSRVFLVPLFLLSALVAVYGVGYLHEEEGQRHLGLHWAYVLGLVLGMTLVFTADDGFVFLVGWELMSVIPFFWSHGMMPRLAYARPPGNISSRPIWGLQRS